jgi:PAS domain S-box-containing protein
MDGVSRYSWFRSARSSGVLLVALVVMLGVAGYVLTSTTIRQDREEAAEQRAQVEAVHTQEVLGRARAYVAGLANVLAQEPEPGLARFASWAGAMSASVGLNDVLWVERVSAAEREGYERLRGVRITRVTPSGRIVPARAARSYLPATYTSQTRPELRPGVDVSGFRGLGAAIRDRARIFAVGASRLGALGAEPGFYLLQAATFARGPGSRGYLVAFVPRGWFSTTLGGDPRRVAISEDGKTIEGSLDSVEASAGFEMLGRDWRIDVAREPLTGLQSTLPWLALAWPFAIAGIAFVVGRAITQRRRAQREVERIFEMSLDMICVAGFDGRFRAVNPAFERTLGYPPEELIERPFMDFVHPDDRDATLEAFHTVVAGGELTQFENRYICKDGSVRWLQWSSRPIPDQDVAYSIARDVTESRRISGEQAALRRVATLVAQGVKPTEVYSVVSTEVGRQFGTEMAAVSKFDPDGAAIVVVGLPKGYGGTTIGSRYELDDSMSVTAVYRTRRSARIDAVDWSDVTASVGEVARREGTVSSASSPIVVEGELWGALTVSAAEPLPPDAEERLDRFTDLVATAVANAESRAALARLAEEQAALRRVATLVAEGAPAPAVFDAVAAEMARLLDADGVTLSRYEPAEEVTVLAHFGANAARVPPGTRVRHSGENVTSIVRRTKRPARLEHYEGTHGPIAELVRDLGVRASVGAPIIVDGQLWGITIANWQGEQSPPADTEERMTKFAALLDTAIANADSRDQLAASRARLVRAGDEARRRVVRDLHDGAQQRLVHTIVSLKLARRAFGEGDGKAETLVQEALQHAERSNAELRELAHGILPPILTRGGLRAGVDAVVSRLDLPVRVDVPAERFPAEIEASAYFIVAEALTNVMKHSHAERAEVRASVEDGTLRVQVRDDGIGGADADGPGLVGIGDRATALGGRLYVESPTGAGTLVTATLPLSDG